MRRLLNLTTAALAGLLLTTVTAQAQQGPRPAEHGLETLKKEGKVSGKMLREDERAERSATARTNGRMAKKPKLIREEDRLAHRKSTRPQPMPAPERKRHTTLE